MVEEVRNESWRRNRWLESAGHLVVTCNATRMLSFRLACYAIISTRIFRLACYYFDSHAMLSFRLAYFDLHAIFSTRMLCYLFDSHISTCIWSRGKADSARMGHTRCISRAAYSARFWKIVYIRS